MKTIYYNYIIIIFKLREAIPGARRRQSRFEPNLIKIFHLHINEKLNWSASGPIWFWKRRCMFSAFHYLPHGREASKIKGEFIRLLNIDPQKIYVQNKC